MKSKDITLGGIMIALTVVILYSTSLIPINTLTILTIACAVVPVTIIRSNIKTAFFVYIASSILSFFIVPINISILYFLFFGIYGIIKYFAEKKHNIIFEIGLKYIYFNIILLIGLFIFENVIGIDVISNFQVVLNRFINDTNIILAFILMWIIAQVAFAIIDYALTLVITLYMDKFHKRV